MSGTRANAPAPPAGLIPVTVLTGFLGAGKTTLINRLFVDPDAADTAVVINEVGAVGLDHLLVAEATGEPVLLAGGCLCCALRGDLADTLMDLLARRDAGTVPPFRRVVIETTGLADPAPVLQTLVVHPGLAAAVRPGGLVPAVDAILGPATLDRHAEARRQVVMADRLVVTKEDLVGPEAIAALKRRLTAINPAAPVLSSEAGAAAILAETSLRLPDESPPAHRFVADGGYRTATLVADGPLPVGALAGFLDALLDRHGGSVLRLKGLAATTDDPSRPLLVEAVQHVLSPWRRLPAWPDADRRTRLVLILEGEDPEAIRRLFDGFAGRIGVDVPDLQAMTDNPLAF